MTNKLV